MRPPYIHNGFLASLEVADNTDVRNSVDIRNNGDVRRSGDVRNTGDMRNRNKDETNKREEARNSGAARNKTVKFKMEPSVQLGKRGKQREYGEGWPLLTVETEANGDSKST